MTLEKDIQQNRPFTSEKEKVLVNLIFTHNQIIEKFSKQIRSFDISMQQYNVLRILNGQKQKAITILQISERMLDRMSNTSRLVDKLVSKKLVERTINTTNKRSVDVIITRVGMSFLQKINDSLVKFYDSIEMEDENLSQLSQLLDDFRKTK